MLRFFFAFALTLLATSTNAQDIRPPGQRPDPPGCHALVGGKVVVAPGKVIDPGTVVIRDGRIEAVGADVKPPADARVWDAKGWTIYAGLIDAWAKMGDAGAPAPKPQGGPMAADSGFLGAPGTQRDPGTPGPGAALPKITPERRMVDGFSPDAKAIAGWREIGFAALNVVPSKGILRGTTAFVVLGDGDPNTLVLKADVWEVAALVSAMGVPEELDTYPSSHMAAIAAIRQAFSDAAWHRKDLLHYELHAADRQRPPADPSLDALAPCLDGKRFVAFESDAALVTDYEIRLANELGLKFLIRASGQEWRRPDLAGAAGSSLIVPVNFPELPTLPDEADWAQVSLDQFRAWDWAPENPAVLVKRGIAVSLTCDGLGDKGQFRKNLRLAIDRGLTEDQALSSLTVEPAKLCGLDERLGTIEKGKIANLTVVAGSYFDPEAKLVSVWVDGRVYPVKPGDKPKEAADKPKTDDEKKKDAESDKKKQEARDLAAKRVARAPMEERGPDVQPGTVLVKGATIWTSGPAGRIDKADLLCSGGKIIAVGTNLETPAGALVIDGTGLHVTPGLIDCHSHMAIVGDVNEGTIPSSAMVRIQDVVNSETDNIAQELAGGLTCSNLLHGSANPIGGQNCVIKLREGDSPDGLRFKEAIPGIKFALGENVKQSNWGEKFNTRFPQSRMGVRTFYENRFTAAQQYLAAWEAFEKAKKDGLDPAPVRRDLELETLGELLTGKRIIHCHSYRADEILMLIREMDKFGIKIGTFQHVLEGYKVADEIAKHGAGGSCFTDWWAYKFEVYDAIPYCGALMRERGVCVSFNSDSSELARRMYLEAAKAVKYGGVDEPEALKFVTLNPAIQLRIDKWVGSLEPEKNADFVIWSASPLDSRTVCLQTWIDGKRYFERGKAGERAAARLKEWTELREKAKKVAAGGGGGEAGDGKGNKFFETCLEHRYDYGWQVGCEGAERVRTGK
ncbi:MAG: amidohydrolase family protein [Planctomycetes bacterium]|nr:amidohydrolase family protein [Planctomycetota bacterium]